MKEVLAVIFAIIFLIVFFAVPIVIFGAVFFLVFKIIKNLIEKNKNNNYSPFTNPQIEDISSEEEESIKKEYYLKTAYQIANKYGLTSKAITKEEDDETVFEQPKIEQQTINISENKAEKKSYDDNYDKDLNGNYNKEL